MKAAIVLAIDDAWLDQHVAEFNNDQERDGDAFRHTPRSYVESILQDLVVGDVLPLVLWSWKFAATLLVEAPRDDQDGEP